MSIPTTPRPRKHWGRRIVGAIIALIVAIVVISALASSSGNHATVTPASPASPASSSSAAPAAATTAPATTAPAAPATTAPAAPATTAPPAPIAIGHFSGSENWNSPAFTLNGNAVTVTYTYSSNIMAGETGGDNFIADLESSGDSQSIVNSIGTSGGTTTTVYPDTSFGGSTSYHLSVTATGNWSFTITEAGS